MKTPMIVAFEGIDGSGKSTTLNEVSKMLRAQDIDHICVSETRHDVLTEHIFAPIRNRAGDLDGRTQQLLIHAMRRYVDLTVIAPALAKGQLVLVDRYYLSTLVYQDDPELTRALQPIAIPNPSPVIYMLFDLPAKTAMARLKKRPEQLDLYDQQEEEIHERRRQAYLQYALTEHSLADYVQVLNASQPTSSLADQVMQSLTAILSRAEME